MAIITKEIAVDTGAKNMFQAIVAKQNDSNSRFLRVTLLDEGTKIEVPTTATATINALRADNTAKAFAGTVNSDGTVTVPLTNWMLELDDTVKCSISILSPDSQRLTSTSFSIDVETAEFEGGGVSEDDNYDILLSLITKVSELKVIDEDTEFIFNGGDASGSIPVDMVVDTTLSAASGNAIANKAVANALKTLKTEMLLAAHPVGAYYVSASETDPSTLFGGTWERIKGVFLYGVDDGEDAGITGGEREHTLTVAEMPAHSHHPDAWAQVMSPGGNTGTLGGAGDETGSYADYATEQNYETTSAGGGVAHNNMPPYRGVYIWQRTA